MKSSPLPSSASGSPVGVVDHQRTYVSDVVLHQRLMELVGQRIALPNAQQLAITRGIGPLTIDRTLVTHWFDTADRALYRSGAMLRCRGRQSKEGTPPSAWQVESRVRDDGRMVRVRGGALAEPVLRHDGSDDAVAAVGHLTHGQPVRLAGSQTKVRRLLVGSCSVFGSFAPEVVVALDEVHMHSSRGQSSSRLEVELQVFTQLPWTKRVSPARLQRFSAFASVLEDRFQLVSATVSSYQAMPEGLLS